MLAWVFSRCFPDSGWLIGGEVAGFPSSKAGNGDIFITEVDESDGTHTFIHPAVGIVPNVDDDHDWSVGGTQQLMDNFRTFGRNCQKIFALAGSNTKEIFANRAEIIDPADSSYSMLPVNLVGFQRWNGALVLACTRFFGISDTAAVAALAEFPGVERRLSCRGRAKNALVIEDYAHHPAEVAASIAALRRMTGSKGKLTVVFQPHRYARLEKYFDRLAAELSAADKVFIVPVFAAWCETGSVGSAELAAACGSKAEFIDSEDWDFTAKHILRSVELTSGDILAVIGAGTIGALPESLVRSSADL
jgi:UDP-N-acetylmuramate--alanine ligase